MRNWQVTVPPKCRTIRCSCSPPPQRFWVGCTRVPYQFSRRVAWRSWSGHTRVHKVGLGQDSGGPCTSSPSPLCCSGPLPAHPRKKCCCCLRDRAFSSQAPESLSAANVYMNEILKATIDMDMIYSTMSKFGTGHTSFLHGWVSNFTMDNIRGWNRNNVRTALSALYLTGSQPFQQAIRVIITNNIKFITCAFTTMFGTH